MCCARSCYWLQIFSVSAFPGPSDSWAQVVPASTAKTMSVLVFDRETESIESPITGPQIQLAPAAEKPAVANGGCHDVAAVPQLLTGDGIEGTQDRGGRV